MNNVPPQRKPHAALDLSVRYRKGRKIERLLALPASDTPYRLLEVGAGAGGISSHFANHPSVRFEVDAVDVVDNRQVVEGYRFTLVENTALPFGDESFDVVISNHVIEHVGADDEQARHLSELRRLMRPQAVGYLAMPNRWMLIEPHYRLALLSWWPEAWRSAWLRLWRKGNEYDCRPLSCGRLERLLAAAGFQFEQLHSEALRATFEIESPGSLLWRCALRYIPDSIWRLSRRVFPTLIYRLRRQ